ncbi:unnamed protein product [Thlaspi arvense]|uniref:Protein arginine methyltransferase NDUFAF7 n=1 Tax=Thlaspi arvense TaxID=13288 RepID=A0AAU9REW3_THLAR|nr:unnamed protein product [Thlaspi arvense]
MALIPVVSSRKLPQLLFSRNVAANVDQFELPCFRSLRAFFSTQKLIGDEPVLVRDFIHTALYDPNHGYFSQRSRSVGVLERSIKFNQLDGRKAYMKLLEKVYRQSDISWFTPVELFKPWYAHGIAEAILRTTNLSVPLKIYEIGGGSGTCAKGVLDYIMLNAPERIYNNMSYTSIEISPSLAKIQKETVAQVGSHLSKFRVECRDASDLSGWSEVLSLPHVADFVCYLVENVKLRNVEQQPCWVIMLEVLDNLPHDLVYSESQVSPWMEVLVENKPESEALSELYNPLEDPLIKRCIDIVEHEDDPVSKPKQIWSKLFPKPRRSWLPTGCLKLLEVLHEKLPKMSLIASDFSFLPDVKVLGERAPLVSTKKDGCSSDYSSYLDAKGDADIFFPTDFWLLERMDHYCSGWRKTEKDGTPSRKGRKRRTLTLDTSAFMDEFGLPSKTSTKDGYNPLLDDFKNTKFYLSVPTHNTK